MSISKFEAPIPLEFDDTPSGYHLFSDGQQPPSYVVVWYEYGSVEKGPDAAVSLKAQGPLSGDGFASWRNAATDDEALDRFIESVANSDRFMEHSLELSTDPNFESEGQGGALAAREAARYLFAMAGILKPQA